MRQEDGGALERRLKENPTTALAVLSYVADEKQRRYRHAARLARPTEFERTAGSLDALCKRLSAIGAKGRPPVRQRRSHVLAMRRKSVRRDERSAVDLSNRLDRGRRSPESSS
jgi:CRP-like cAMP-binding protein